jgi:4-hydroxy-2-oxoheptanedioate aldolase
LLQIKLKRIGDLVIKLELNNKKNIGCFVGIPSPGLIELVGNAGFDFVILDMEHGPIDWGVLENLIRACEAASIASIVRVPECRREYILKALDCGASGIQVPMVDSKQQANEVVRLAKYPPLGIRGAAFSHRAAKYGSIQDKGHYLEQANTDTRVVIHVENMDSVNNIDEILDVEGIDVVFIGPTDLAVSMGYSHDLLNKQVVDTIQYVTQKILSKGKAVGILATNVELLKKYEEQGISYLCTSIQSIVLEQGKKYMERSRSLV